MTRIARILLIITAIIAACPGGAARLKRDLDEVEVTARRPMHDIGLTVTPLDSAALRESIARSMADVLAYNSPLFVKSYGRGSLSTVSFRGTSASHTQVSWNGLPVNSPMLGMTDFSTIPSYFVDRAALLHGSSSVTLGGGGLGGAVVMSSASVPAGSGLGLQYVQGAGSYTTFDEFLRVDYGGERVSSSTRIACASSANDFHYINRDKKENVYGPDGKIIASYYPRVTNRSGAFRDFNAMQDIAFRIDARNRLDFSAWVTRSQRELPLLTTDYSATGAFDNVSRETTLRTSLAWTLRSGALNLTSRGGYILTFSDYDYSRSLSPEVWAVMTRSRSRIQTLTGNVAADIFSPDRHWLFTAALDLRQHFVKSHDHSRAQAAEAGAPVETGYNVGRVEASAAATVRWQPDQMTGISAIIRQEMYRDRFTPVIPALLVDITPGSDGALTLHASVSRNYRYPSLNDLYFMPGGNPSLRSEKGWSYDAGLKWGAVRRSRCSLTATATWFDSRIDDWILWLPTVKGFFSPRNVKSVHAYGVELSADLSCSLPHGILAGATGRYSWTPSVNCGEPLSEADRSVGRQLPYVPRHSASIVASIEWRRWVVEYKWCYYSRRFTMSSSDISLSGSLAPYFMSNISAGRSFATRPADLAIKLTVNNLLDEEYQTVLSRPMPGINFEVTLSVTPRFGSKNR